MSIRWRSTAEMTFPPTICIENCTRSRMWSSKSLRNRNPLRVEPPDGQDPLQPTPQSTLQPTIQLIAPLTVAALRSRLIQSLTELYFETIALMPLKLSPTTPFQFYRAYICLSNGNTDGAQYCKYTI